MTWEKLQQATYEEMRNLLTLIRDGFPGENPTPLLAEFWRVGVNSFRSSRRIITWTAECTVFCPNIKNDISSTRHLCKWCNRNAPSQAIVADFFEAHGTNYLVVADRLSAWTEAYHTKMIENGNKSKGLITTVFGNIWGS